MGAPIRSILEDAHRPTSLASVTQGSFPRQTRTTRPTSDTCAGEDAHIFVLSHRDSRAHLFWEQGLTNPNFSKSIKVLPCVGPSLFISEFLGELSMELGPENIYFE